jgi:inosine/xanthosine triphosphatase
MGTLTKTVIVASTNPTKIEAVRLGFNSMFPATTLTFEGVAFESGVSDQPASDAETLLGAQNRAANARRVRPDADFWVGVEGGVENGGESLLAFAWIVVLGTEGEGYSRTATFTLPDEVAALVRQGVELGEADDRVFGRTNSKQANGAVGILTHDALDRAGFYSQAVLLALIPFANPHLSFTSSMDTLNDGGH